MALDQINVTPYKITEGFNDNFSELVNNEFLQPTFDDGFTNKRQFAEKRPWWTELFSMTWNIIDYHKNNDTYYVLEAQTTSTCKLRKVSKDTNQEYTVKSDISPSAWISYSNSNNKWTIIISWPDTTSIKVTNSTPTNATDPTSNPYWDYSDTLKDTWQTFDNSYFNVYWVITSHSEAKVINRTTTTPPVSPTSGDRYIVWWSATWARATKDWQIAQRSWTAWVFTVPATWYFCYSTADSLTYRCAVSAWPVYTWTSCLVDNWWKEWTRFEVTAVLSTNELRINSPVTLNNFDSYSIYGVLSNYTVFKKSWDVTTWKVWVNLINDSTQVFSGFTNTVDMETFDWYTFWCTPNRVYRKWVWQELSKVASYNFPIYDSALTCIEDTWDFLLIGWTNKCYALIRTVQSVSGEFSYSLRWLTQLWLFSKKSILTYAGSVYTFLSDHRRYGLSVTFSAQSAQVQLKDVWIKIQKYFDRITEGDEVEWFRYNWNYGFLSTWTYNQLIVYNDPRQGFLVHEYGYWVNGLSLMSNTINSMYANKMLIKWGEYDIDKTITQRIVIIWPDDFTGMAHRLYQCVLMFWHKYNDLTQFKVTIKHDDWEYTQTLVYRPNRTDAVLWLNSFGDGTLGTALLGKVLLGWWEQEYQADFWVVALRDWKISRISKVTITNEDNTNFIFGSLYMVHGECDQRLVPIRDVV